MLPGPFAIVSVTLPFGPTAVGVAVIDGCVPASTVMVSLVPTSVYVSLGVAGRDCNRVVPPRDDVIQ